MQKNQPVIYLIISTGQEVENRKPGKVRAETNPIQRTGRTQTGSEGPHGHGSHRLGQSLTMQYPRP